MNQGILEEPAVANGEDDLPSNDILAYKDGLTIDPNDEEDYIEDDEEDYPDEEAPAANKPEPPPEIRSEEHIVEESPGAFAKFSYKIYVPEKDEDEDEDCLFKDEDEKRKVELYIKEYTESDGFDVEHFCNKICGELSPLPLDEDELEPSMLRAYRDCKLCVEAAIDYANQKNNWNLELDKIIKCNWVWGGIDEYYATFNVKNKDIGATRTYQAQVDCYHFTGKKIINKFRLKPDSLPEPEITNRASESFFVW